MTRALDARRTSDAHVPAFLASLGHGRDDVRSSYWLAGRIGVGQRSVGFIANAARRQGHLVGSVHGEGYYLIETQDELDATISHIEIRIAGIQRTIMQLRHSWSQQQNGAAA